MQEEWQTGCVQVLEFQRYYTQLLQIDFVIIRNFTIKYVLLKVEIRIETPACLSNMCWNLINSCAICPEGIIMG